jgi:Ca2+-binding EF-hand superfamily protein
VAREGKKMQEMELKEMYKEIDTRKTGRVTFSMFKNYFESKT